MRAWAGDGVDRWLTDVVGGRHRLGRAQSGTCGVAGARHEDCAHDWRRKCIPAATCVRVLPASRVGCIQVASRGRRRAWAQRRRHRHNLRVGRERRRRRRHARREVRSRRRGWRRGGWWGRWRHHGGEHNCWPSKRCRRRLRQHRVPLQPGFRCLVSRRGLCRGLPPQHRRPRGGLDRLGVPAPHTKGSFTGTATFNRTPIHIGRSRGPGQFSV